MTPRHLLLLLLAASLTGCMAFPAANAPRTGAVATGQPLAVVDDVKVWTTRHKEKVGEAVHRDDTGKKVGSTDVYAERTRVHQKKVWYMVQGPERVDDEDFFRIAGDAQALEHTRKMRTRAKRRNRNGRITMVAGLVGMVGGLFIKQPLVRTGLMLGGGGAMSVGWYLSFSGARQMQPEYHAVPRSVAERAAMQYNGNLRQAGGGAPKVGVGYAKKF